MGTTWTRRLAALAMGGVLALAGPAIAQEVLLEIEEENIGAFYGFDGGVDWNGDTVPDLLISFRSDNRLRVHSGADGSVLLDVTDLPGTVLQSRFAPDMTGDGEPDLVVGISRGGRVTSPPPQVLLVNGVTGGVEWASDGNFPSESFGSSIAIVGDVDSDGITDVAAAGYLVSRVLSGADGERLYEFPSSGSCCPSDEVGAIGDVDGDRVPDVLVGSQRFSGSFDGPAYPENGGIALVVSGRTGEPIRAHRAKKPLSLIGTAVVAIGDVDRDDVPDYAVGANIVKGKEGGGGLTVYSGARGKKRAVLRRRDFPGAASIALLPFAPGDVDRDGVPDVALRTSSEGGEALLIVSLARTADPVLFRYARPEGAFFSSFGRAGDVDGDGVSDVVVGMSFANRELSDVVRVIRVEALPFIPSKVRNARALTRSDGVDEALAARLSLLVKKGVQTFELTTEGLVARARPVEDAKAATGPFGVFLEDGVGVGTFTQVGTLDASGTFSVSATGTVPPELGVASLADVVGRRVQIRDGTSNTLLETVAPGLDKERKGKAKANLEPVSSAFPKAKLKLKATFNPKTGALDVKAKVKKAGEGPFVFELETAPGSEVFEEIARIEASKLKLSTGDGTPLGGALTVDDLDGRGLRVLSGDELVLAGDL